MNTTPAPNDCLIGVRDCGCITAWMSVEHSTLKEIGEFYLDMAATDREVREANTDAVRGRLVFECPHRAGQPTAA